MHVNNACIEKTCHDLHNDTIAALIPVRIHRVNSCCELQDIRFNCRFKDIMRTTPTGDRLVDFRGFNSVLQNTIMPVSFGLTFEETVAVNGPLVEAAPENSSVSKASKPAMPTKQQKPKKEKKDKKTKQQDGSKSKVKKAHKHKHKGTEDDSELLSGIKSDTVQASGSPRVEDIQVCTGRSRSVAHHFIDGRS